MLDQQIEKIIKTLSPSSVNTIVGETNWGATGVDTNILLSGLYTNGNIVIKGHVTLIHPDDRLGSDRDQDNPKKIAVSCNRMVFHEGARILSASEISVRAQTVEGDRMTIITNRGTLGENGAAPDPRAPNGPNGSNGAKGYDGRNAKCPKRAKPGGRGSNGHGGGRGSDGKRGDHATDGWHAASITIAVDEFSVSTVPYLSAIGGNGGHGGAGQDGGFGGTGGTGGKGGKGGDGGCGSSNKPGGPGGNGGTGGNGGDGGNGGRGGHGGDGGTIKFYYKNLPAHWDFDPSGGRKGVGGNGGEGGERGGRGSYGAGGQHGESDDHGPAPNGQDGGSGQRGLDGHHGPDGLPGERGQLGYIRMGQESLVEVANHFISFHPEDRQEELFHKAMDEVGIKL